jgi:hypothetical protein
MNPLTMDPIKLCINPNGIDTHGNLVEIVDTCKKDILNDMEQQNRTFPKDFQSYIFELSETPGRFARCKNKQNYLIAIYNMFIDYLDQKGLIEEAKKCRDQAIEIDDIYVPICLDKYL